MSAQIEDTQLTYSRGWVAASNTTGDAAAADFSNGTYHQCANSAILTGPLCLATLQFEGTGITLFGDSSPSKGRFFCALLLPNNVTGERQWFDGGSIAEWGLNRMLCSVDGLGGGPHEIALGQTADDCGNVGVAIDYAMLSSRTDVSNETWSSNFSTTAPNPIYATDSTVTSSITASTASTTSDPSSTSDLTTAPGASSSPSPSAEPAQSGGGANTTAIGAGVGVGGAALLALGLLALLYWRRKQRRNASSVMSGSTYYTRRNGEKGEAGSPSSYHPPSLGGRSYAPTTDGMSSIAPYSAYSVPEVQQEQHRALKISTGTRTAGDLEDPRGFAER